MRHLNPTGTLIPRQAWKGVTVRIVDGEHLTLAIAELEPGVVVPRHVHVNEQLGTVIEGSAVFVTDDETVELGEGGTYRLLSNVPHQVEAGPHGAVFVECFSPVRADWAQLLDLPGAELRWPASGAADPVAPVAWTFDR